MASTTGRDWEQMLAACRDTWPGVELDGAAFRAYLAARGIEPSGGTDVHPIVTDLFLACACLEGDARAVAAFESHCTETILASLRRLKLSPPLVEEVRQRLRAVLMVGDGARPPALVNYAGRGRLKGWVGVVAARQGMKAIGSTSREVSLANDVLDQIFTHSGDPELDHLKSVYLEEFRRAFRAALGELGVRERTILKQRYLDGVGVGQLARAYGTHRATMSRWLTEARERVARGTRDHIASQLVLRDGECDSVLRLIESRIELPLSVFN